MVATLVRTTLAQADGASASAQHARFVEQLIEGFPRPPRRTDVVGMLPQRHPDLVVRRSSQATA